MRTTLRAHHRAPAYQAGVIKHARQMVPATLVRELLDTMPSCGECGAVATYEFWEDEYDATSYRCKRHGWNYYRADWADAVDAIRRHLGEAPEAETEEPPPPQPTRVMAKGLAGASPEMPWSAIPVVFASVAVVGVENAYGVTTKEGER